MTPLEIMQMNLIHLKVSILLFFNLFSHNMYQYSKFFSNVRQSIQDGTFEQYSATFVDQFGSEPERTGEIHAAQAIVEAALSKRNRLDGSNSSSLSSGRSSKDGDSSSGFEGDQGAMSKEDKAQARREMKEQERYERREKNRVEGLMRKEEKQQQLTKETREP